MSQATTGAREDTRDIDFLGITVRAHDTGEGQVCAFESPAGPVAPPHRHAWAETHYVIEGEMEYMIAGDVRRVGAGGFVTIPGDTLHALNAVAPSVRWIEITAPVGPADFFEEVSRQPGLDPTNLDDMTKLVAMAATYDVEVVLG